MKKIQTCKGALLAAGLALALLAPASAQTQDPAPRGDSQKPVVNTYDKRPDPSGKNQDLEATTYDGLPGAQSTTTAPSQNDVSNTEKPKLGDDQKPVVPSYDKRPDPKGDAQKLDAVRYDQQNEDNDGKASELEMNVLEGAVEE
jgi:hypothetical protein